MSHADGAPSPTVAVGISIPPYRLKSSMPSSVEFRRCLLQMLFVCRYDFEHGIEASGYS